MPFESNVTLLLLERGSGTAVCGLVGRVVDLDLLVPSSSVASISCLFGSKTTLVDRRRVVDLLDQLRVRRLLRFCRAPTASGRQPDEQHDDDEREERAAEEAVHASSAGYQPLLRSTRGSPVRHYAPSWDRGRGRERRRTAGSGTARRSRGRSRSRTGSGSRSRRSAPAPRSRAARASSAARRPRASPARGPRGSASDTRASGPSR